MFNFIINSYLIIVLWRRIDVDQLQVMFEWIIDDNYCFYYLTIITVGEAALCRSMWSVGVNRIAVGLRCIWPPSLVEDAARF